MFLISLYIVISLLVGIFLFWLVKTKITTYKLKKWRVNDIGYLIKADPQLTYRACQYHPNHEPGVVIIGWSDKEVLVSLYNGERWYIDTNFIRNISIEAREREERVNKYMNITSIDKMQEIQDNTFYYNEKPLSQLNKEELLEVLDIVVKEEDYNTAIQIRELLKNK